MLAEFFFNKTGLLVVWDLNAVMCTFHRMTASDGINTMTVTDVRRAFSNTHPTNEEGWKAVLLPVQHYDLSVERFCYLHEGQLHLGCHTFSQHDTELIRKWIAL